VTFPLNYVLPRVHTVNRPTLTARKHYILPSNFKPLSLNLSCQQNEGQRKLHKRRAPQFIYCSKYCGYETRQEEWRSHGIWTGYTKNVHKILVRKSKRNRRNMKILFNPLQTKRRPLYLKTQSVPRCKHFSSRL